MVIYELISKRIEALFVLITPLFDFGGNFPFDGQYGAFSEVLWLDSQNISILRLFSSRASRKKSDADI